jgi:hypothetical protein
MAVTVSELCSGRGLKLKRKGRTGERGEEWCGPCPGCGGEDRFLVWPEQNRGLGSYACRRCGKAGDVIQFLMDFDNLCFRDAKKAAGLDASAYRSSCPRPPRTDEAGGIRAARPREALDEWRDKATEFARKCHEKLLGHQAMLAWLDARGLPLDAVRRFHLGWNPGEGKNACLMRPRAAWGLPDAPPQKDGDKPKTRLWLPRGLVIPQQGPGGKVSRLRIRRPEEDRNADGAPPMKYYVVPGSGMSPMWIPQRGGAIPAGTVCVLVESELDAEAVAFHAGDVCSVLGLMTAQVKGLPQEMLDALGRAALLLVATDAGDEPDKDGRRAGAEGWKIWRDGFPQAKRWPCVRGKDPGEMFAAGVSLRSWVLAGLPDALAEMAKGKEKTSAATEPAPEPDQPMRRDNGLPFIPFSGRPVEHLTFPVGPLDSLVVLARAGVVPRVVKDDYVCVGHERWSGEDQCLLFGWLRRHGEWVRQALLGEAGV